MHVALCYCLRQVQLRSSARSTYDNYVEICELHDDDDDDDELQSAIAASLQPDNSETELRTYVLLILYCVIVWTKIC